MLPVRARWEHLPSACSPPPVIFPFMRVCFTTKRFIISGVTDELCLIITTVKDWCGGRHRCKIPKRAPASYIDHFSIELEPSLLEHSGFLLPTPPVSCSSSWTYEMEFYNSIPGGLLLQNALSVDVDTNCFPSGFGYDGRVADPIEVYNPGACPAGYTTATESFNGDITLAVCCQRYGRSSGLGNKRSLN